jgi:hypothetical protein
MFKKSILILSLTCGLYFMQVTNVMAAFDPETAEFSQMNTLKNWVATEYHMDEAWMRSIQENVAKGVPQNPLSDEFTTAVVNDSKEQNFGRTFRTLAAIELPFLEKVHKVSLFKKPTTIEFAAARGYVSWKIPLAFENGGTHFANELSHIMMNNDFEETIREFLIGKELKGLKASTYIKKIPGSCFDIFNSNPELFNAVDVIFVQNMEHFLNPLEHQQFISMIAILLTDEGYAFLCAEAPPKDEEALSSLFDKQQKIKDKYSGFMQFEQEGFIKKGNKFGFFLAYQTLNVKRPSDDTAIEKTVLENIDPYVPQQPWEKSFLYGKVVSKKRVREIRNYFTPEIYRAAIEAHPSLEVVSAFYIDKMGAYKPTWSKDVTHAAAIIRKKKKETVIQLINLESNSEPGSIRETSGITNTTEVVVPNNVNVNVSNGINTSTFIKQSK